jgi:hypothetical protein
VVAVANTLPIARHPSTDRAHLRFDLIRIHTLRAGPSSQWSASRPSLIMRHTVERSTLKNAAASVIVTKLTHAQ